MVEGGWTTSTRSSHAYGYLITSNGKSGQLDLNIGCYKADGSYYGWNQFNVIDSTYFHSCLLKYKLWFSGTTYTQTLILHGTVNMSKSYVHYSYITSPNTPIKLWYNTNKNRGVFVIEYKSSRSCAFTSSVLAMIYFMNQLDLMLILFGVLIGPGQILPPSWRHMKIVVV